MSTDAGGGGGYLAGGAGTTVRTQEEPGDTAGRWSTGTDDVGQPDPEYGGQSYCPTCGTDLDPDANYCSNCGEDV